MRHASFVISRGGGAFEAARLLAGLVAVVAIGTLPRGSGAG